MLRGSPRNAAILFLSTGVFSVSKSNSNYFKYDGGNFGDDLNDVLVPRLFGIEEYTPIGKEFPTGTHVVAIGSTLNTHIKMDDQSDIVVYGAGVGYQPAPRSLARFHFSCVRGPLTCEFLGLDKTLAAGDSAYALQDFFQAHAATKQEHKYAIVPHHLSLAEQRSKWNIDPDLGIVIDASAPLADVIRQISSCGLVVSECLHGAICADALGIPTCIVQTSYRFQSFKWGDWAASMQRQLQLNQLVWKGNHIDNACLANLKFEHTKPAHVSNIVSDLHARGEQAVEMFQHLRDR